MVPDTGLYKASNSEELLIVTYAFLYQNIPTYSERIVLVR